MNDRDSLLTFGPVPSRRLGNSLGINNIPPKICTYSCIYCQLGSTGKITSDRRAYYSTEQVFGQVRDRVKKLRAQGQPIDYLSFVPDGEPTLDMNLGQTIASLKSLDIKIAVITNASLIWRPDVREDLSRADWVSLKVDSVQNSVWRKINRPHGGLMLNAILDGMIAFSRCYEGELVTETMLVEGINDDPEHLHGVADHLHRLRPSKAYLSIPTRPPALKWVRAPDENAINSAYQILVEWVDNVEYLIGYEGNSFACTGNPEEDLLSITAVHPMREEAVSDFLTRAGADWSLIRSLLARELLVDSVYEGKKYFMRRLS